jgi:hypothetical protein
MLLELEKRLFEASDSDSTIENRLLLKFSFSVGDNGGRQKADATKNHYYGEENSYQDSQIWLPSSNFHHHELQLWKCWRDQIIWTAIFLPSFMGSILQFHGSVTTSRG